MFLRININTYIHIYIYVRSLLILSTYIYTYIYSKFLLRLLIIVTMFIMTVFYDWLIIRCRLVWKFLYIIIERTCIVLPCDLHFLFFFFFFFICSVQSQYRRILFWYTIHHALMIHTYIHIQSYTQAYIYIYRVLDPDFLKESEADQELSYAAWLYRDRFLIYFYPLISVFFFHLSCTCIFRFLVCFLVFFSFVS